MTKKQVARLIFGIVCVFIFFGTFYVDAFVMTFYKDEWWVFPTLVMSMGVLGASFMGAWMSFWAAFDKELFGK